MSQIARAEVFAADEVAIVYVMNRTVRRCFLLGNDAVSGKNYDHRKRWIDQQLIHQARYFGIDLLCQAIMSNYLHLVLRSRPDVVAVWDDTDVARRWLMLCPLQRDEHGQPVEPTEFELNRIRNDKDRLAEIRLLDETAVLACAAYVDLNPIRAALPETIEGSDFTSAQKRARDIQAEYAASSSPVEGIVVPAGQPSVGCSGHLAPVDLHEGSGQTGPCVHTQGTRCSDKGFLGMPTADYLSLLDWTARQSQSGRSGSTPQHFAPLFERLGVNAEIWCCLVRDFGKLFSIVAGQPCRIDDHRSRIASHRYRVRPAARDLLATA